jgi:hypothetical protein
MVKRKIAIEQMAREIAELEGCGDTATSCRQSNCACMDHARAALAALEPPSPHLR